MNATFRSLLCLSILLGSPALAQDAPQAFGTLNIISLISDAAPCEVTLAGKKLNPEGLKTADITGWFFIPAGSHIMHIQHPTLGEIDGTIEVAQGSTQAIVIFLHPSKRTQSAGKPLPPDIRIRRFPAFQTPKGFALKAASMLVEPTRYTIGPDTFTLQKAKPIDIPKWNGSGFTVAFSDQPIASIPSSEDSGSYYLFLAENPDGKHTSALVSADPIAIPEP